MSFFLPYLGVENETLRDKLGEVNEKWLNESKSRIKLSYDARISLFWKE
jgi:hypothetical protein